MQKTKRRILCLDGGGIKGAVAAAFLEVVEETSGKRIADHFDLIAGTSTGGIVALGLGLGLSAKDIKQFYVTSGPQIFNQAPPTQVCAPGMRARAGAWLSSKTASAKQFVSPKYQPIELKAALQRAFGEKLLGDSTVRLVIPAYHADKEDVYVFKTRHHDRFQVDWKETAVNVALATAAAPTYFAAHPMPSGAPLIDGGVWANNPAGLAAVEARGVLGWNDDDLYILRLGCTEESIDIPVDAGLTGLLLKSTALFMQGQSRGADGTAMLLSGHREEDPRFFSVQPKVSAGKFKLDGVEMVTRLCGLGAAHARETLPLLTKHFLCEMAEPFVPVSKSKG